jgi:hypothetical protein
MGRRIALALLLSVAVLFVAARTLLTVAHTRFVARVDAEARALFAGARRVAAPVDRADLQRLPAPVARWLEASGIVGRPRVGTVWLRQRGSFRAAADGAWMPIQAEQWFSTDPPGFVWRVDATMVHLIPIAGRDKYAAGRGQMLIKVGSLVPLVNAADDKIDQGAALRYLGETIWFPSAALGPYVSWDAIDDTHAKATMRHGEQAVAAVFTFDSRGRVVRVDANRYLGGGKDARLTRWSATCSDWRRFDGVEVPSAGEVSWNPPEGGFSYFRWEIVELRRDQPG